MRRLITGAGCAAALALGLVLASPQNARAAYYNFTYSVTENYGGANDYTGVFDVSGTTIVGITGSSSFYGAITGLVSQYDYEDNDNQFSKTAPYLTNDGVSFTLASGGDTNLYYFEGNYYGLSAVTYSAGTLSVTPVAIVTHVPEPMSLALFGVGLLGLGLVRADRRVAAAGAT